MAVRHDRSTWSRRPALAQKPVGERIRRRRQELGLPQLALAGERVSASYISYVESGKRNPSVRALRHIARVLNVSPEYLETGSDATHDDAWLADAELELRLGEAKQAIVLLEEVRLRALHANDSQTAARAQAVLIVAHATDGYPETATALFERMDRSERPSAMARPDMYTAVARAYAELGNLVESAAVLRGCLAELKESPAVDDLLFIRYSTQLSYALTDAGDIAGATAVLVEALERKGDLDDPYAELRLRWSLGRLHHADGRPELASHYFRQAIALCERTEDRFHLAAAHESLASTLLDQSEPSAALPHIDLAEEIYGELGDKARMGMVAVERARFALQTGNTDGTRELALFALDLLDSGNAPPDASGDAWRTLGELYTSLQDYELAEHCLRTAIEALADAPAKYRADALRSLARLLEQTGREREALQAMWQASDLAGQRRARESSPSGLPEPGSIS